VCTQQQHQEPKARKLQQTLLMLLLLPAPASSSSRAAGHIVGSSLRIITAFQNENLLYQNVLVVALMVSMILLWDA